MSDANKGAPGKAADRTAYLVDILCRLYVEGGGRWVSVGEWSTASGAGLAELWTLLSGDGARPHDELGVQEHGGQLGFYRPYARTLAKWAAAARMAAAGLQVVEIGRLGAAWRRRWEDEHRDAVRVADENRELRTEKQRLEQEVDAQQATAASWRRAYEGATAPWRRAYEEHGRTCAAGQPKAYIEACDTQQAARLLEGAPISLKPLARQAIQGAGRASRSTPFDELLLDALVRAYVGNGRQPVTTGCWIHEVHDWPAAQPDHMSRVKYLHGRFLAEHELRRFGLIRDSTQGLPMWAPTKRAMGRWAEWKLRQPPPTVIVRGWDIGDGESRTGFVVSAQGEPHSGRTSFVAYDDLESDNAPTVSPRDKQRMRRYLQECGRPSRVPYTEGVEQAHPLHRPLAQLVALMEYVDHEYDTHGGVVLANGVRYKVDQVAAELRRVVAKIRPADRARAFNIKITPHTADRETTGQIEVEEAANPATREEKGGGAKEEAND